MHTVGAAAAQHGSARNFERGAVFTALGLQRKDDGASFRVAAACGGGHFEGGGQFALAHGKGQRGGSARLQRAAPKASVGAGAGPVHGSAQVGGDGVRKGFARSVVAIGRAQAIGAGVARQDKAVLGVVAVDDGGGFAPGVITGAADAGDAALAVADEVHPLSGCGIRVAVGVVGCDTHNARIGDQPLRAVAEVHRRDFACSIERVARAVGSGEREAAGHPGQAGDLAVEVAALVHQGFSSAGGVRGAVRAGGVAVRLQRPALVGTEHGAVDQWGAGFGAQALGAGAERKAQAGGGKCVASPCRTCSGSSCIDSTCQVGRIEPDLGAVAPGCDCAGGGGAGLVAGEGGVQRGDAPVAQIRAWACIECAGECTG